MDGRYAAARSPSIQIRPPLCGIGRIRTASECASAKCECPLLGAESDGASSLFGIGTAHWCHREYDAAMIWVDRAATRRPHAPGILAQLAGCHIRLGNGDRGRTILETMMRLRPEVTAGHISDAFWFDKPCPSVANVLSEAGLTQ